MGRGGGSVCDRGPGSLRFGVPPCPVHVPTHHTQSRGPTDFGGGRGLDPYHPKRAVAAFGRRTSVPRQRGRKSRKDKELPEPERQSLQREFFFCYMLDKEYANG
jgi:hypothetical protein